jgi:hypothetical protein
MEFEEWLYAGGRGRGYMQGVGVLTIVIVLIYYYFLSSNGGGFSLIN